MIKHCIWGVQYPVFSGKKTGLNYPQKTWHSSCWWNAKDSVRKSLRLSKPRMNHHSTAWWFQSLWKIWVRQLGWWNSQYIYIYMESHKKNCSKPPTTSKMMIWWLWCKAAHGCPMRGPRASDTHCTSPWGSKQSLWMSQHRDSDGKWWKWEYSLKKNSPSQPLHLSIGIQNGSWWLKMLSHSLLPSGKRLHSYWSHGPVEIVDFPNYNMVDLSSSLRKRLPEGHHYPIGPWCWYVYIYICMLTFGVYWW